MSDLLDPPSAAPAPTASPVTLRKTGWWAGLRPLLLRVHFYAGVFVAPFILVAALTGLMYTTVPTVEKIVYHDTLTTAVGPARLDLRAQLASATAAVPGGTVTEIRPPATPDATTRVSFDVRGLPDGYSRTAFVDPYTGHVKAVLDTYGEWLPLRAWFDSLHRTLLLGDVGRVYSELAASWLGILALSGLAVWVARKRRTRRVRRTLLPETSARGRARLRSWHGALGLWIAVGMLFLSATGITWSQFAGTNVSELRAALSWSTPSVSTTLPAGPAVVPVGPTGVVTDRVLAGARAAGLSDPVAITPAAAGKAWTVKQVQRSWPEKQDAVAVDPATGTVVSSLRFADWPIAAKLARWGIDAHMGLLFGLANQIALALLAIAILCLVGWGYRMWWLRRPTRAGARTPAGTQKPSTGAVVSLGLVAVVLGIFLPVLGVSLVVFTLADALWQHRRARSPE
ncbi:PepSY domain-containing protein [Amycolatopsis rhabdoformis]|uniref:PepSY domain-containing protein n=1 Tax=Amycolatopsis rhabdoformis TaxID=1448059 RepID=A0ABZ1ICI2_9PSEU|nr:PepSY domain-containing protein [Amycolatopsis rhabdoformis]WSE32135.1 PepSY domain-containing protein [Amycolatopsis rhabdoformis]